MKDQVKYLKCVRQEGNTVTFTEDGLYAIVREVDGLPFNPQYEVLDNHGMLSEVPLEGGLWTFEVVDGSTQEGDTMGTNKLTPRSLGCFRQVADVIGEEAAEIELQKVIDHDGTVWLDTSEMLVDAFGWNNTRQGCAFWDMIDDGLLPEGYQKKESEEKPETTQDAPVFGDVLHINGEPFVFIKSSSGHYYTTVNQEGVVRECDAEVFDEYTPDPIQELRKRILERWKGQSLYHAYDTEASRADVFVGDIIEFVIENLNAEFGGD